MQENGKLLSELLDGVEKDVRVSNVSSNSKRIKNGGLFLCVDKYGVDRHPFVKEAIQNGAIAVVQSKLSKEFLKGFPEVTFVKVEDVNEIESSVYARFESSPEKKVPIFAFTGTDGKTSCTLITKTLIGKEKCAIIGTNGAGFDELTFPLNNTTPDSEEFYSVLNKFVKNGAEFLAMEFSSEAEHYARLKGLKFKALALTSISSEHLNTHKTLENYISAKLNIFLNHLEAGSVAILNADDSNCNDFENAIKNKFKNSVKIAKYGKSAEVDLQIIDFKEMEDGSLIKFKLNDISFEVESPLYAFYNAQNLAASILVSLESGIELEQLLKNVCKIKTEGRLEEVKTETLQKKNIRVFIDFAHTAAATKKVLEVAQTFKKTDKSKIISVLGQPGGRDTSKRAEVGNNAVLLSDKVILTADDPRFEDVTEICQEMMSEMNLEQKKRTEIVENRELAIKRAFEIAESGDIIMILGKGAEKRQVVKDEHIPYSDLETVLDTLKV